MRRQSLLTSVSSMQEHRLQTAEQAEAFYRKREKKAAPAGWEAFNNKTLFKAYERRAGDLPVDMEVCEASFDHDVRPYLSRDTFSYVE